MNPERVKDCYRFVLHNRYDESVKGFFEGIVYQIEM